MNIQNRSSGDLSEIETLVSRFYPYAKESLGFDQDANITFESNTENASNPLGNTAYYAPEQKHIVIFVDNRHPKDILRSLSHELVHHSQNCRGDFDNQIQMEDGYAQKNPHLREMEREAYEKGNMVFRDWTDTLDESLRRKFNTPMLNKKQIKNIVNRILECCGDVEEEDEDEPGKHSGSKEDKKFGSGAMFAQSAVMTEESIDTIVEPDDAIRMNRIKPFVMIRGKTYKWEESDGVTLKVVDDQGADQQFRLSDIEDIKVPDIQEPIEEWYRSSLYDKLLTEYSK